MYKALRNMDINEGSIMTIEGIRIIIHNNSRQLPRIASPNIRHRRRRIEIPRICPWHCCS